MKSRQVNKKMMIMVSIVSALVLGLSAVCFSQERVEGAQEPNRTKQYPPLGKLVDIGGWRHHLNCTGARNGKMPTIVLESGAGDFSVDSGLVQPDVARFARVCSYDRAGAGWSDLGPRPRTMRQVAYELHTVLKKAGEKGPFIMVGQSVGGLFVRVYASQYPQEVAGMVLVDRTHEDTVLMINGKRRRQSA